MVLLLLSWLFLGLITNLYWHNKQKWCFLTIADVILIIIASLFFLFTGPIFLVCMLLGDFGDTVVWKSKGNKK